MSSPAKELTRRDRNKRRNQREILEAALSVFAEKGYRDASMQEIADRADFAVSTLYALFENKGDLYRKVSTDVGRRSGEIFEAAMASGKDEYEMLVNCARAKSRALQESQAGVRMLEHELYGPHAEGDEAYPKDGIGQIYERFMERIQALFKAGIRKGLFVKGDPMLMAMGLDHMTNALLRLSRAHPETYSYDDRVDEVLDLFFGAVLVKKRKSTKA